MKLRRTALVAVTGAAGMFGFGAFHGAQAISQCTPTPTVRACAGADPRVNSLSVSSAESATVFVNGDPNPICVGRVTIDPFSGSPVTYDPNAVYECY
jgi:hypothetical protein